MKVGCEFEHEGETPEAVAYAPQSINQGATVSWHPVCQWHADDWWDGADWGPIPFKEV